MALPDDEPSTAPVTAEDDPVQDLTLKDAALLLGAGLAAGALASFGFKELVQ